MPQYAFRDADNELVWIQMTMAEYSVRCVGEKLEDKGRILTRDMSSDHQHFDDTPGNWPMHSMVMSVHPSKIAESRATLAAAGIDVDYDSQGRAILRDPEHRRQCFEHYGWHDLNSYGGKGDARMKGPAPEYGPPKMPAPTEAERRREEQVTAKLESKYGYIFRNPKLREEAMRRMPEAISIAMAEARAGKREGGPRRRDVYTVRAG